MFARDGKPHRDDVQWLADAAGLPATILQDLYSVPDWRAFYALVLRLPAFAFSREAVGKDLFERLLLSLGPPVGMAWTADHRPEPGPHVGNLDAIERGLARGWLWNPDRPNQPAEIEFIVGGQVVHTARASYLRSDVRADGRGSGFAGFETQLPYHLIGSELAIGARLSGAGWQLADSPKRLEMPPELRRWQMRRARVSGPLLSWLRRRLDRRTQGTELRFVLTIAPDTTEVALLRTLASVRAQWCSRWRLSCVVDPAASTKLFAMLRNLSDQDARLGSSIVAQNVDEDGWMEADDPHVMTLLVPIACGEDLEPDVVHRFLDAALTGAEIVYADEIGTLDVLLDAILPFRRAPYAAEMHVADRARTNLMGYAWPFAQTILTDWRRVARLADEFARAATDQASLIVHVPGLFRWRPGPGADGTLCLFQTTARSASADVEDVEARLHFKLSGEPTRHIVLNATGLVPRTDSIDGGRIAPSDARPRQRRLSLEAREIAEHIDSLALSIAFVVRIDGEDVALISATMTSLRQNRFPNWRLWSADSVHDDRAPSTYLLWIEAGEILDDHALYWFAARAAAMPEADIIYADQDVLQPDGTQIGAGAKPDWSPDLLESRDYIGSAAVFRLLSVGAHLDLCRSRYDLVLRLTDTELTRVEHVREVALHQPEGVERSGSPQREAREVKALQDRLTRTGRAGSVTPMPSTGPLTYAITVKRNSRPPISTVLALASRDRPIEDAARYATASAKLIEALSASAGLALIVVVDALNVDRPAVLPAGRNVRVIEYGDDLPNLAAMINFGAASASADLLLVLDGPYGLPDSGMLDPLVDQFAKEGVGVAGARLREGDRWRDAVTLAAGFPSIERSDRPGQDCARNVMAVLAPFMTTKALFESVGGYTEPVSSTYCHVDFCLKVRRTGKRVVLASDCRFDDWHAERLSAQPDIAGLRQLAERWPRALIGDPYSGSPP